MKILENIVSNSDSFFKAENLPIIQVGDTVKVTIYLELPKEQEPDAINVKERIQVYEGVVISKKGAGINTTVTVRRIMQGIGIERCFLIHSPKVRSIEIKRSSKVRRAKLYYLRNLSGKATRLKQRFN